MAWAGVKADVLPGVVPRIDLGQQVNFAALDCLGSGAVPCCLSRLKEAAA